MKDNRTTIEILMEFRRGVDNLIIDILQYIIEVLKNKIKQIKRGNK